MPESGAATCCKCCTSFIITSGVTALFMWLSLRTEKPTCSIQDFYVPALNRTANSNANRNNHTIYFDLKLDNKMKDKGVNYANINLTFFYSQNDSRLPVANYTVPGFYQGHGKKARRRELVVASGLPWAAALDALSNGSAVNFGVDLATRVKFKILFWYTKRHSLIVAADVEVNKSGRKVNKKGIKLKSKGKNHNKKKLKSEAPYPRSHRARVGPIAVFAFFLISLL
ncbi:hypothetical protein CDL12_24984 [Handroanthus impetiginosus]|uniref:Late embryogenesis abundant protein LEA-2 subgroup domain-containing protein n=1 Tax=Handroanthus impetiginosus TaxID=429701 RepID=A0A2G9GBY8_9LAMI|nr:hypothetical protein CDL12_24984 [Handroanthus impetiginosus]